MALPSAMPDALAVFDPLISEESALGAREAELARREAALVEAERLLEAEVRSVHARWATLDARLRALAAAGRPEAAALADRLPGLAPPPGTSARDRAIQARRAALDARQAAAGGRENVLAFLKDGLDHLVHALNEGETEAARLAAESEAARQASAAERSRPSPQPAPVAASAAPEGRRHPRARLDCEVDLGTDSNFYVGFAQNVSAGGLFVATFDLLPVGREIELGFTLPTGERIEARATVRWIREPNDGSPDVWPGMGLQFQALPPGAEEAIATFMSDRDPLFFPD